MGMLELACGAARGMNLANIAYRPLDSRAGSCGWNSALQCDSLMRQIHRDTSTSVPQPQACTWAHYEPQMATTSVRAMRHDHSTTDVCCTLLTSWCPNTQTSLDKLQEFGV